MAVSCFYNQLSEQQHEKAEAIEDAICEGIGPRPEHEQWRFSILADPHKLGYTIPIEGPDGFRWEQGFTEWNPEVIQEAVFRATH